MKAASIVTDLATETFQLSHIEQPKMWVLVQLAAREGVTNFAILRERLHLRAGLSEMQALGADTRE